MPRRGENIYKRKDGRWEARILLSKGKYRYVYAKSYKEVKEKKKKALERKEIANKHSAAEEQSAAVLFQRWLDENVAARVKPTTYESYHYCITKYVIPFYNDKAHDHISELTVKQFAASVFDNPRLSTSYKNKIISIYKTALKSIIKSSANSISVLEAVKSKKTDIAEIQVFTLKEQRLIEKAVLGLEDKRALGILLCFYTGIRLGELCALRWNNIDFDAGVLSVVRTVSRTKDFKSNKTALVSGIPKNQKSIRKIPLPGFIYKIAREMDLQAQNADHYILSGSVTPIDPRTYQKLFKRVLAIAGVKERKFHAIRHTFATRMLELGVDIKTLSEILGHSNVSITLNVYAHSLFEQKKIAIDKLNDLHVNQMQLY